MVPEVFYRSTRDFKIILGNEPSFNDAFNELTKHKGSILDVDDGTPKYVLGSNYNLKSTISKAAQMKPEEFKKYKSIFIDYLIEYQVEKYKLVTIVECLSHRNSWLDEGCFIFTANSYEKCLWIILENINPNRSTIMFQVEREKYKSALGAIFDYFQSSKINKRRAIQNQEISPEKFEAIWYKTLKHDSPDDWKRHMGLHH